MRKNIDEEVSQDRLGTMGEEQLLFSEDNPEANKYKRVKKQQAPIKNFKDNVKKK